MTIEHDRMTRDIVTQARDALISYQHRLNEDGYAGSIEADDEFERIAILINDMESHFHVSPREDDDEET